jgi:hypothetical protein
VTVVLVLSGAGAAIFGALVGFVVVGTWWAYRITGNRD